MYRIGCFLKIVYNAKITAKIASCVRSKSVNTEGISANLSNVKIVTVSTLYAADAIRPATAARIP